MVLDEGSQLHTHEKELCNSIYLPELEEHSERYDVAGKGVLSGERGGGREEDWVVRNWRWPGYIGVTTGWHVISPEPSLYGPTLDTQLRQINMAVDLHDARCSLTYMRRPAQYIGP